MLIARNSDSCWAEKIYKFIYEAVNKYGVIIQQLDYDPIFICGLVEGLYAASIDHQSLTCDPT